MAQHINIFERRDPWAGPITASLLFHGAIVGLIVAYGAWIGFHRNEWGTGDNSIGDSFTVKLEGASAIPLPRETPTQNIVANNSPAPARSEPKEEIPQVKPEAIPIPETTKIKPKEQPRPKPQNRPEPVQQANNRVAYGGGGQVAQNFTTFNDAGIGAVSMAAGADFGSRYAYYVRQVTQILSQNWMKYEVDPHTTPNATVTIAFDISRNGEPTNVKILQSSGVPSLDTSAYRTLQRIDTFGPLPSDYRGSSVGAEFEFRYTPMKR